VELIDRIRIVFEDESVVIADKPAGVLTVATDAERSKTLYAALREYLNRKKPREKLFVVHRLDREASGLLVFAKTIEAKQRLQDQFKNHTAGRRYIVAVEGRVKADDFTIRSYLTENAAYRVYSTSNKKIGKLAITHMHVLKRNTKTTLLEVRLETGRKHQIRVHLAESGHPVVGDKNYGTGWNPIRRLALHGARLDFKHPASGKLMTFHAAYPKSFDVV
jgi:23S rRNA pseudouridine1911/1915/1917 synthase